LIRLANTQYAHKMDFENAIWRGSRLRTENRANLYPYPASPDLKVSWQNRRSERYSINLSCTAIPPCRDTRERYETSECRCTLVNVVF
jgi:hypothetical protein